MYTADCNPEVYVREKAAHAWLEDGEKGVADGRTDGQTDGQTDDWTSHIAAWSQLKIC